MRVLHIISGLRSGGAEWMLYRLLRSDSRGEMEATVLVFGSTEPMGERIEELGVDVVGLGLSPSFRHAVGWHRLLREIRRLKPDVIQTWMYHADLAGGIAARFAGRVPVVWGIHHTTFSSSEDKSRTLRIVKLCARLSARLPRRIVCCSEATLRTHIDLGYDSDRMQVIPNGFDLELFRPDISARQAVRSELGLPDDVLLIGMVARYHPQKDHGNLIEAASLVADALPTTHFVLCGSGVEPGNRLLVDLIASSGMSDRIHLLGARDDTPRIYAALDLYTSPASHGEAFPLVVGEAMACGVPCVVTNVGDSARIVGDTGLFVPPRDPEALARAFVEILSLGQQERQRMGERARERIRSHFSIEKIRDQYFSLYRRLAGR